MTFNDYWEALTQKNPKLLEDVVKVKKTGLYNMLKQAYEKGAEHSREVSNKVDQAFNNYNQKVPDSVSWFTDFINKRK